MKNCKFSMKCLFLFFLFASVGYCEEKPMTLDECIALALKNSHKIEMSAAQVSFAEANKKEAFASFLPQFSLDGKYEQKNTARDFSVFSEYGGAFSSQTATLTANWLLFDFGGAINQWRAGKKGLKASRWNLERTEQAIEEETKIAYFRVLEARQTITLIQESMKTLQTQKTITKDFFEQGMVAKSDCLFVEVQIGEKKKALLRAQNEHLNSSMALNRCLGRPLLEPVFLEDMQEIPSLTTSVQALQKLALQNRPDLKALHSQIEALQARKSAARAAYAPKLYAFGGYSYQHDSLSNQKNWISGGVGMQFSLYDGGKTGASGDRVAAQIKENKARLSELENGILLETSALFSQLQEQLEAIEIDQASILLSEENLRTTTDRYQQGLVSIRDLLAAEEQRSQSSIHKTKSIYHALMLWAKLLSVTGGF